MYYSIKFNPVFLKNPLLSNIQSQVELKLNFKKYTTCCFLYISLRGILSSTTTLVHMLRAVHMLARVFPGISATLRPKVPERY